MMKASARPPGREVAAQAKGDGARVRGILDRGFGAYAFDAASWQGPLDERSPQRLDAVVLAVPPVATPASAFGIERLQALVTDPAYQLR
jgi:hypothetical protein